MHLPGEPQFEGVWAPPTLDGLVAQVVLCIQLVGLKQVRRSAGVGLLQDVSVPRQEHAALQRHPLQVHVNFSTACMTRSIHALDEACPSIKTLSSREYP